MRIAVFDSHRHDRAALDEANASFHHELVYFEPRLNAMTAGLASGFSVACSFVNDHVDRPALTKLRDGGVRLVALRSAGFNPSSALPSYAFQSIRHSRSPSTPLRSYSRSIGRFIARTPVSAKATSP
jgi:hypothetical protein